MRLSIVAENTYWNILKAIIVVALAVAIRSRKYTVEQEAKEMRGALLLVVVDEDSAAVTMACCETSSMLSLFSPDSPIRSVVFFSVSMGATGASAAAVVLGSSNSVSMYWITPLLAN